MTTPGADLKPGVMQPTGRDLDVAIEGDGFFTVQALDGTEAYTRNGSFEISAEGELRTRSGLPVIGEGGPITIPQDAKVSIGRDGTVSVVTEGQANNVNVVGRLKLVKLEPADAIRGGDGLFRSKGGGAVDADPAIVVNSGVLESSNVNAVSAMVDMINLARQFEMQMKLLQNAEQNDQRASQLLSQGG